MLRDSFRIEANRNVLIIQILYLYVSLALSAYFCYIYASNIKQE